MTHSDQRGHGLIGGADPVRMADHQHPTTRDGAREGHHAVGGGEQSRPGGGPQIDATVTGRPSLWAGGEAGQYRVGWRQRPRPRAPGYHRLGGVRTRGRRRRGGTTVDHHGGPPGWRVRNQRRGTIREGPPEDGGTHTNGDQEASNGHVPTMRPPPPAGPPPPRVLWTVGRPGRSGDATSSPSRGPSRGRCRSVQVGTASSLGR